MKIDPYNHKERYTTWRTALTEGIVSVSEANSTVILRYLDDMERGFNVASGSPRGGRSYSRMCSLRDKLCFFATQFHEHYALDCITEISEEQLGNFFFGMKKGDIVKSNGESYKSVDTYVRIFRAFWHWHQKVQKKKDVIIADITTDMDTRGTKPDWVYLTEEQVKQLAEFSKFKYKVLILFLYDSGIRAPTELMNVKVSDLYNDGKELMIREEISKTFGRRIKLLICSDILKEYVRQNNLRPDDYLFTISASGFNKYLKRIAKKLFGDASSPAGKKYSELTMYHFRHCSCCYWLPRYKSESALKYRFGWKRSDEIHYYSELLGMKDTIAEEDLLIDTTKTELEQQLEHTKKERDIMQDRVATLELQMTQILELVKHMEALKKQELARERLIR